MGDAELRLLLKRTSEAAVVQWRNNGYVPPSPYLLKAGGKELRISNAAAQNATLASLFDALGLHDSLAEIPGGLTVHRKGDVIEQFIYYLLGNNSAEQQYHELLACCLAHCLSWMALERDWPAA